MVPEHSDHRLIKGKLNEALFLVRGMFSDEQYTFIIDFINAGEWWLAFDTLCEILSEEELPVSQQLSDILKEIKTGYF
ncbi:MAG: MafI family immunity protein [Holosporales bacterium]|jgi:hypothetical protein